MDNTFAYAVRVWNPDTEQFYKEYGFIQAPSLRKASKILETCYGNTLEEIELHVYHKTPLTVSKKIFDMIVAEWKGETYE